MTTLTTEQQERVKALAAKSGVRYNEIGVDLFRFSTGQLYGFASALLSEFSAQKVQEPYAGQQWKSGNEYLPYHPSASHVSPAYREGWNNCYKAATPSLRVNPVAVAWHDPSRIADDQGFTMNKEVADRWPHIYKDALGVIMEADKVGELVERKIEGGVYKAIANMADRWSDGRVPDGGGNALRNFAIAVRELDKENAVRIAAIEGDKS